MFANFGCLSVPVHVDEEEVGVWEGFGEAIDLICPHCGRHNGCMEKDDSLLGWVYGSGRIKGQHRLHLEMKLIELNQVFLSSDVARAFLFKPKTSGRIEIVMKNRLIFSINPSDHLKDSVE